MAEPRVLAINPGSTTTRVALFEGESALWKETRSHSLPELNAFATVPDQLPFRTAVVRETIAAHGGGSPGIAAISARGGLLRPVPCGTFVVSAQMLDDLRAGVQGQHPSNLGGLIAAELAREMNVPAYVVDPTVVDELSDLARVSGHPRFARRSIFHALNQRAALREAARQMGRAPDGISAVVAHLGGGFSVAAWERGRAVDVNNALDGEGPFSTERSGTLPAADLVRYCLREKPAEEQALRLMRGAGGMAAHLGTNDAREVEARIAAGDAKAELIYRAMAYRLSQEIGARAAALSGRVDRVVLTGGLARSDLFAGWVEARVKFIAPVVRVPGEREMEALAAGALAVLRGQVRAMPYPP